MVTLSTRLGVAIGLCAALTTGAARADVVYTATLDVNSDSKQPFVYSFDLTNAQVATGSFNLTVQGQGYEGSYGAEPAIYTGDVNGFNALDFAFDEPVVPNGYLYGRVTAAMTFNTATDALETININYAGGQTDAQISGSGSAASLNFASDDPHLCPGGVMTCVLPLSFTATSTAGSSVPEPATFAVLGAGLLGLTGLRRHFTTNSTEEV